MAEYFADKWLGKKVMGKFMKTKLLGLFALCFIWSCTENVSEKLSASPKKSSTVSNVSEKYVLSLTNDMSANFTHHLHAAGDSTAECKLSFASLPETEDYVKSDRDVALDCILDVGETDLFEQGFKISLDISEGMCEYVNVQPFNFYKFQPGFSRKRYYEVDCEDAACNSSKCGVIFKTWVDGDADGYVDFSELSNPVESEDLVKGCYFKHENREDTFYADINNDLPNCDEGYYEVVKPHHTGSTSDASCAAELDADILEANLAATKTSCDGKIRNCLEGPGEDFGIDDYPNYTSLIYYNETLSAINKSYSIQSPRARGYYTNMLLANFNRSCAGTNDGNGGVKTFHDIGTTSHIGNSNYASETDDGQGDANDIYSSTDFAGYLAETWARTASAEPDGYAGFTTTSAAGNFLIGTFGIDDDGDNRIDAIPYATGPFRGYNLGVRNYYSFDCLDNARDIRAKIRLFVREWDRKFDKTSDESVINVISDKTAAYTAALMDNQGYLDDDQSWNDILDWDDFLQMTHNEQYYIPTAAEDPSYYVTDGGVTIFNFTGDNRGDTKINNTCNEMSSPFDWRNFPNDML